MNNYDKIRYQEMKKLIKSSPEKIILDIGGGLYPISKGFESKKTVIIDGDIQFEPDILMDLNNPLPIEDNSIDLVIAGEILEHLINPFMFLQEINRVLKKGGELILSTPNIACLKSRIQLLLGKLPSDCARAYASGEDHLFFHKTDWNWDNLKKCSINAGFQIEEKKTVGIFFRNKLIVPSKFCPLTIGEKFIIKLKKI